MPAMSSIANAARAMRRSVSVHVRMRVARLENKVQDRKRRKHDAHGDSRPERYSLQAPSRLVGRVAGTATEDAREPRGTFLNEYEHHEHHRGGYLRDMESIHGIGVANGGLTRLWCSLPCNREEDVHDAGHERGRDERHVPLKCKEGAYEVKDHEHKDMHREQ